MPNTADITLDAARSAVVVPEADRRRAVFHSANFAKLWTATAISEVGNGVRITALPLLAATITRDPALVAGVAVAGSLPWLLFALLSGVLSDRLDRRLLMGRVDLLLVPGVNAVLLQS